jgi:hypothetical protein
MARSRCILSVRVGAFPVSPDSTKNLESDNPAFFASSVRRLCSSWVSLTSAPFGYCFCRLPIGFTTVSGYLSERDSAKTYPALRSVLLLSFQLL